MSYQIFARKYRPQSFEEVIGQEAIVKTLNNALTHNRLHQAYLFCGSRGVGKTSIARIFAKSLNCEKGPTVTPCQECSPCVSITKSNSMDVLEIDGASNTGVDDVRELREQAKYLPTSGKYKIYIIDEVHMLSTNAFNALLKILEEPPPHIIFIFATTEPHKIPVTILSRCQRFDCKRIPNNLLISHLQNILQKEKIALADESLSLIAFCAEGSVRDSLSLLDQVISYCGSDAPIEKVREILGLTDRALLYDLLEGLLKSDIPHILNQVKIVYEKGFDLKILSENLLELIRHLLILAESSEQHVDLLPGEKEKLREWVQLVEPIQYLMLFQILARGTEELARSDFPRLIFETTLIKMVKARELVGIPELLERLEETGSRGQETRETSAHRHIDTSKTSAHPKHEHNINTSWPHFVKKVLEEKPQIGAILEHARPIKMDEANVILGFEKKSIYADMLKERLSTVEEILTGFFNKKLKIKFGSLDDQQQKPFSALEVREEEEKKQLEVLKEKALANPIVKKTQEILGAKVKEVKKI